MRVLRHAYGLCKPGGVMVDLTSVPPAATVERDGVVLGRLDQRAFLRRATLTEEAVDRFIADGLLVEEAAVRMDALKHFDSGADLLDDIAERKVTRVPAQLGITLAPIVGPLVERSTCLLRRLRVPPG